MCGAICVVFLAGNEMHRTLVQIATCSWVASLWVLCSWCMLTIVYLMGAQSNLARAAAGRGGGTRLHGAWMSPPLQHP